MNVELRAAEDASATVGEALPLVTGPKQPRPFGSQAWWRLNGESSIFRILPVSQADLLVVAQKHCMKSRR